MTGKPGAKAQVGTSKKVSAAVEKALDLLEAGGDEDRWEQLSDTAVHLKIAEYREAVSHVSDELKSLRIESADLDSQDHAGNGASATRGPEQVNRGSEPLFTSKILYERTSHC